jgi:OOP family OmpA-OmpF porin
MNTVSFGITYYIGKKSDVHADWFDKVVVQKEKDKVDVDARKRLDEIETLLSDVDKDGVPDYLDFESNTPGGVAVDTRGRFIDLNNNSIPDELESNDVNKTNSQGGNSKVSDVDVMKTLVEGGYLNVFFKVNEVVPDDSSTSALYTLLKFLKLNENVKISLKGFADVRGGNEFNEKLSENRAKFVRDFLVKNGVNISRISFSGKGVEIAIITGNDELDYRFARRVSVFIE